MAASGSRLLSQLKPRVAAVLAMVLGLVGLVGWLTGIKPLRVVMDGFPPMSVITALSLILLGYGLYLSAGEPRPSRVPRRAEAAIALVGVMALLTIGHDLFGVGSALPFISHSLQTASPISSPHSAVTFLFLALGLLAYIRSSNTRMAMLSQYCAMVALGITFIVMAGYLFTMPVFYGYSTDIGMALHALAGSILLALGLFNLQANLGFAALYYGDGVGSHLLRTMIPLGGLVLLMFAIFSSWGMQLDKDQGFAVSLLLIVFLGLYALGRVAVRLNAEERHKILLERQYTELFEGNPDAIVVTNDNGYITQVNSQFESLTGHDRADVIGDRVEVLIPERRRKRHVQYREAYQNRPYARAMGGDLDIVVLCRDGAEIPVHISIRPAQVGGQRLYILAIRDIRERKALLNKLDVLSHEALHDALTGLPNRRLLENLLTQTLASARREGRQVAVCYCDLDGFKSVNDIHGHQVGDALLVEAAKRMKESLREEDTVARLGGDEFVTVLSKITHADDASQVAQKLIDHLSEPYVFSGKNLCITASVGIALFPADGGEPHILIKCADEALYAAKNAGKNQYRLYA